MIKFIPNQLRLILIFSLIFSLLVTSTFGQESKKGDRPNIVVILSDDVGFEEFGIYNVIKDKPTNTPNIDKLGAEGVTFKTAYAQSICGPSRAMLYSGNYASNNGAYDNKIKYIPNDNSKDKDRSPNFIKVLHDSGYKTAVVGKWHNPIGGTLGLDNKLLGVDEYISWNADKNMVQKISGTEIKPEPYWEIARISKQPILPRYWKPAYVKNGELMQTTMDDYGPDILSNFIIDFIMKNADNTEPFLAFYPMVLAHGAHCVTPYDVADGAQPSNEHFRNGDEPGNTYFQNQIRYADKLVGDIWQAIQDAGIADNTIFIFASDNGTTSSAKGKGVEYGVHVPVVVAGAGIKQRGMTDELMDFTDVLPTLADFAQTKIPSKYNVDGISLKPFLTGATNETKPVIFAQPGITSMVRTKDFLLEAVCPLYGYPQGRFYKTNGSFDGRDYENITHNSEYVEIRKQFETFLDEYQSKLPTSFDNPLWEKELKKGFKHFNTSQQKKNHLSLPKKYKFYNEEF